MANTVSIQKTEFMIDYLPALTRTVQVKQQMLKLVEGTSR